MGNLLCMRLFLPFRTLPPWGADHTDDRVSAGVHMHMLNSDLLLPLAAMPVENLEQGCKGAGELISLR